MCLLEKYQDVSIKVIDQQNCIQLLKPGIHHIYNQEYYYFSLFALNESILSISQAEYTLDHYYLKEMIHYVYQMKLKVIIQLLKIMKILF